jgi:hypothetical protein
MLETTRTGYFKGTKIKGQQNIAEDGFKLFFK